MAYIAGDSTTADTYTTSELIIDFSKGIPDKSIIRLNLLDIDSVVLFQSPTNIDDYKDVVADEAREENERASLIESMVRREATEEPSIWNVWEAKKALLLLKIK